MSNITFSTLIAGSFRLANKNPALWLGWVMLMAAVLVLGRISLLLAIIGSVTGLFMGVGLAEAIDRNARVDIGEVVRRHFPTAMTLALIIAAFWFAFRVVANVNAGESEKILRFFLDWQLTPENLSGKSVRELFVWLYSAGIVALLFVLAMLGSFGSWFSYPLMALEDCRWSEARDRGRSLFKRHAAPLYKLAAFVALIALIGMGLVPLLTPLIYMLVSTLMYVSYRDVSAQRK